MITEDYVSFEVAKLFKEKGFDEPCRSAYIWNTEEYELCDLFSKPLHFNREGGLEDYEDDSVPRISAPTHQKAMKWLRKVHKVNIEIHYNRFGENYKYLIIYKPEVLDDIHSLGVYFHYEDAVEAALKYALENLI